LKDLAIVCILKERKNDMWKIFCKHDYKLVANRQSNYTSDYQSFSDLGWYEDKLYKCSKCGKEKIKTVQGPNHPLYHEWKRCKE